MGESERENELAAFEARLGAFQPGASRVGRDLVMYQAGRAAAMKDKPTVVSGRGWPAAFAGMTTVAAMLLVALVVQQRDRGDGPSGPAVDLARKAESEPAAEGFESGESGTAAPGIPIGDVDTLIAQLPGGRRWQVESQRRGAVGAGAVDAFSLPQSPVNYLQRRELLLDEMSSPDHRIRRHTES